MTRRRQGNEPLFNFRLAQANLVLGDNGGVKTIFVFACNCHLAQTDRGYIEYRQSDICGFHKKELRREQEQRTLARGA